MTTLLKMEFKMRKFFYGTFIGNSLLDLFGITRPKIKIEYIDIHGNLVDKKDAKNATILASTDSFFRKESSIDSPEIYSEISPENIYLEPRNIIEEYTNLN